MHHRRAVVPHVSLIVVENISKDGFPRGFKVVNAGGHGSPAPKSDDNTRLADWVDQPVGCAR
jgi:hypothetical protein